MVLMSCSYTTLCRATVALVAGHFLLATSAAVANPYSEIADRNIFGLLDPPPPPVETEPEPEPEPLPNVKITGITTIKGVARALVKLQIPANPKKKEPAREESYILIAGGAPQGGVQVLEIQDDPDPDEVKVRVRQRNKESWLGLEKDSAKVAAAPTPPPGANPRQVASAQVAQKLAAARMAQARAGAAPQPGIPSRNVRTPQGGTPGTPGYGQAGAATALQAGRQAGNRTRVVRDYGLSREEQVILIEANREMTVEDVALGDMPPLPPTEMTPPELDPTTPPRGDELDQFMQDLQY